jgi:energy-coupling factor transporter transmembrane protein EcfT
MKEKREKNGRNILRGRNKLKFIATIAGIVLCSVSSSKIVFIGGGGVLIFFVCVMKERKKFVSKLILFFPFLLLSFLFPSLFTQGKLLFWEITYEGIMRGGIIFTKLLLTISWCLIFTLTTPYKEIAEILDWFTFRKLRIGEILVEWVEMREKMRGKGIKQVKEMLK